MSSRNLNNVDRKEEELSITMRFFILLTLLFALVSCGIDPQENGAQDSEIQEITHELFHETLHPGLYRITPDDFMQRGSHLQLVYIRSSNRSDVLDILCIKFDPEPWMFTEDDEQVILHGEEILVGIKSDSTVFTEELDNMETYNVVEYEGIAISNVKRPHIVFRPSPPVPETVSPLTPVNPLTPAPEPVIIEGNGDED